MSRFVGKAAIITGSSSGIGRAAATLFAKEGAALTITGRNAAELEKTRSLLISAGSSNDRINVVVGDITDNAVQRNIVNSTVEKFGKLDILVNNAGAALVENGKMGFNGGVELYEKTMKLNVTSVIQLIELAREHLIKSKGEIVNISSIAALHFGSPVAFYAMAKAALDQLTRAASIELIAHGVRVNGINPGIVRTGFTSAMGVPAEAAQQRYDKLGENPFYIPARHSGTPEEIANVIAFLADRNASSYIIGQCIVADGGSSLVMGISASIGDTAKQLEKK